MWKYICWALAAGCVSLTATLPLQAGPVDDALLRRAPQLFRALQEKGYRNVGVLKFLVDKGGTGLSLHAGPLNDTMALRLEEALIRANDERKPIGITRNASRVASETDKLNSFLTLEGRRKLFEVPYPLAWGQERVTVDAFLTGLVRISPDFQTTTVSIQVFDRDNLELRELVGFEVRTDRNVLTDAGESFALKQPRLVTRGELAGLAKAFDRGTGEKTGTPSAPPAEKPPTPPIERKPTPVQETELRETRSEPAQLQKATFTHDAPVVLEVYYDDRLVSPMVDPSHPGELLLPAPGVRQKVHFMMRNRGGEKLGVVLRVNGVNTLYKEADDRDVGQYAKWILEPG